MNIFSIIATVIVIIIVIIIFYKPEKQEYNFPNLFYKVIDEDGNESCNHDSGLKNINGKIKLQVMKEEYNDGKINKLGKPKLIYPPKKKSFNIIDFVGPEEDEEENPFGKTGVLGALKNIISILGRSSKLTNTSSDIQFHHKYALFCIMPEVLEGL